MRQLFTNTNKSLVALVDRSKASEHGDGTGHLTAFYVPEQPVLLNVSDKLGDDGVVCARQGAVLDKKKTAADGGDHAARKEEGLSGRRRGIEHLRDGDYVLVPGRGASLPGPKLHTSAFRHTCPFDSRVIDNCAHCVAVEAIDEVERHHGLALAS